MKSYSKELVKQFMLARGIKQIDRDSKSLLLEFSEWMKERLIVAEYYLDLLSDMGLLKVEDASTAEIGKGEFDSIVKPFNTTIITPFDSQIKGVSDDRIIRANFEVCRGEPALYRDETYDARLTDYVCEYISTYMTQNPYSPTGIKNWEQLHNFLGRNIIVGVYGNIYDKDAASKIKLITSLRDSLEGEYVEEDSVDKDIYCYAVASQRKKLQRSRAR